MKLVFLFVGTMGLCSLAQAQSYLKIGGGYAFPLASNPLGKNHLDVYLRETNPETGYYEPSVQLTEEELRGSYSTGMVSSVTFGHVFSSKIGVEISVGYVFGKSYETTSVSEERIDDELRYSGKTTQSWRGENAFIAPALLLTAGEGWVKPYLTAGPVFAFASIDEKYRHHSEFDVNPVPTVRDEKYSGGISLGLRGAGGLDFQLAEKVHLFSEVAFTGMSYYPKEKETVKYEMDGEDILSTWSIHQRKTEYVRKIETDTRSEKTPSDQPEKALRQSFGMSALMVTAGLKFAL